MNFPFFAIFCHKLPFSAWETKQRYNTGSSDRTKDFCCHFEYVKPGYNNKKSNF